MRIANVSYGSSQGNVTIVTDKATASWESLQGRSYRSVRIDDHGIMVWAMLSVSTELVCSNQPHQPILYHS